MMPAAFQGEATDLSLHCYGSPMYPAIPFMSVACNIMCKYCSWRSAQRMSAPRNVVVVLATLGQLVSAVPQRSE